MKAVVKTAPGEGALALLDWPEPMPEPHQVKLRIGAAGICGTDLHIIRGTWPSRPPVVLGHEFCGTVVEVGAAVRTLTLGDRVVGSNPASTCGSCRHCRSGNDFMCAERVSAGYHIDGAFAEYLCVDARRCHRLPDHVTFRQAALGEPLAVAVHAVIERTAVHAGDLVLVSGPGCVGLLTLQVAKLEGARVVVAGLARDRHRLECARSLGADAVVDVEQENVVEVVRELSGGEGADVVYECSGSAASLALCWQAVRKEGTLVPLGIYGGPIETDFNQITLKELRVIGSYGYVWSSWRRAVQLLASSSVRTSELVSHEFPLDRFEEAFAVTQDGRAVKVVLLP